MLGVVAKVTDRGGVLVYQHSYRHPHHSYNYKTWINYTHVAQVRKKGKSDFGETVARLNNGGSA